MTLTFIHLYKFTNIFILNIMGLFFSKSQKHIEYTQNNQDNYRHINFFDYIYEKFNRVSSTCIGNNNKIEETYVSINNHPIESDLHTQYSSDIDSDFLDIKSDIDEPCEIEFDIENFINPINKE